MVKIVSALAILGATAVLSLPARSAERPDGVRNLYQYEEFSSRHRGWRHRQASSLHYYDPYPWWWHPPYAYRARTYYLPWPYASPDPNYHRPHVAGVVGFSMFGF